MAPDALPILAVICLLVAFIVAVRAAVAWNAIERASDSVLREGVALEESEERLRTSFANFRGKLNGANAAVERGLWDLARFDERALQLEASLRSQRADIDAFRVRYVERADEGLRRARSLIRVAKQLLELRRILPG